MDRDEEEGERDSSTKWSLTLALIASLLMAPSYLRDSCEELIVPPSFVGARRGTPPRAARAPNLQTTSKERN
jgi:hypothetical protein